MKPKGRLLSATGFVITLAAPSSDIWQTRHDFYKLNRCEAIFVATSTKLLPSSVSLQLVKNLPQASNMTSPWTHELKAEVSVHHLVLAIELFSQFWLAMFMSLSNFLIF